VIIYSVLKSVYDCLPAVKLCYLFINSLEANKTSGAIKDQLESLKGPNVDVVQSPPVPTSESGNQKHCGEG
jgi:hypothetical protein